MDLIFDAEKIFRFGARWDFLLLLHTCVYVICFTNFDTCLALTPSLCELSSVDKLEWYIACGSVRSY